jgi:hypothetical protein
MSKKYDLDNSMYFYTIRKWVNLLFNLKIQKTFCSERVPTLRTVHAIPGLWVEGMLPPDHGHGRLHSTRRGNSSVEPPSLQTAGWFQQGIVSISKP